MFELEAASTDRRPTPSHARSPAGGRARTVLAVIAVAGLVLAACGTGNGDPGIATAPTASPTTGETQQPAVEEGEPAPQVDLEMFDGSTRSLSDLYGDRPVIVNFWAS